jgi:hypothetical protein
LRQIFSYKRKKEKCHALFLLWSRLARIGKKKSITSRPPKTKKEKKNHLKVLHRISLNTNYHAIGYSL